MTCARYGFVAIAMLKMLRAERFGGNGKLA